MKQLFYIKKEDQPDPVQSGLLLIAGLNYYSFAIINHVTNELLEFGYYTMDTEQDNINNLFDQHPELKGQFYYSIVAYDVPEVQMIPVSYYKYDDAKLHLDALYGGGDNLVVISEHLPEKRMYVVYKVSAQLHDSLNRRLPSGKFWHLNSVLLKNQSLNSGDIINVDFKTDCYSVIVFKEGRLQLTQTFPYTVPEDVLYYLLKICQEFTLSQQKVKIVLSALIEKDSAIYRELFQYFIELEFETLPDSIKVDKVFIDYPAHYFTTISKLAQCV